MLVLSCKKARFSNKNEKFDAMEYNDCTPALESGSQADEGVSEHIVDISQVSQAIKKKLWVVRSKKTKDRSKV